MISFCITYVNVKGSIRKFYTSAKSHEEALVNLKESYKEILSNHLA